jgi:hypothetical protein
MQVFEQMNKEFSSFTRFDLYSCKNQSANPIKLNE